MKIKLNRLNGTIDMHYNQKNIIYTIKSTSLLFVNHFNASIFKLMI